MPGGVAGERSGNLAAPMPIEGTSLWWYVQARNKKSVTVNLKHPAGREIVHKLVSGADIVVENFRPGVLEKLGLGWETLSAINPALVMLRLSGFGQTGPMAQQPGFGAIGESMGGLRYVTGFPDRPPVKTGISIGDSIAALWGVIGTLLALRHKEQAGGRGQVVDVALYEAVFAMMESLIPEFDVFAYVATDDLTVAVNASVALERPLLVKGEPGTGKTELARQVALSLGLPLIEWHIKSTTKAQQGLYEYDAVSRLRDSQLGDARVHDVRNYIRKGKLWQAFEAKQKVVLLIDEIDKADIEFPNDLLQELDRMEFHVYETGETVQATHRPIILITSNNEKELPDAFLRRCFFHYIRFPDATTLKKIVEVHFPGIKEGLLTAALTQFYEIRETPGLKKKPSTSEVLDWLKLLLAEDQLMEDFPAAPRRTEGAARRRQQVDR
jgi:MoxR-like ATPase